MGITTPQYGTLKTWTTTLQTPSETLDGSPTALPTSEPGTPQVSYTVSSSTDYPTESFDLNSVKYVGVVLGAGQNTNASSQTLYWKMYKNSGEVANGSTSVAASNYYTVNSYFVDIADSDVLELALWASSTDVNRDYKAYQVVHTQHDFAGAKYLRDVDITIGYAPDNFTSGNPSGAISSAYLYQTQDNLAFLYGSLSANISFDKYYTSPYIYRLKYGDVSNGNSAAVLTHASYRPYYYSNRTIGTIKYREVREP